MDPDDDEPVTVAITDAIDLHTFRPSETASVVDEYLHAAHAAGFRQVRVIHGKGTGTQREIVHAVLRRHPLVATFTQDGNWGATLVTLRAP